MAELRFLTGGESHGPALVAVIEGIPAGLPLGPPDINRDLRRRQKGYGRGRRMALEKDRVEILGGLLNGRTTGSPLSLLIVNHGRRTGSPRRLPVPRPGHADLAGVLKYRFADAYPVSERASARETAIRVAVGAVARRMLAALEIDVLSYTLGVGPVFVRSPFTEAGDTEVPAAGGGGLRHLRRRVERSAVRCPNPAASRRMCALIDEARRAGETLGGVVEIVAENVPPGLGSYVHWDRRLDARLGAALMSIPSAKAFEVGEGVALSRRRGSESHDPLLPPRKSARGEPASKGPSARTRGRTVTRPTNRAGGLEGGVSNGEPLITRVYLKPIPTLRNPLPSVNLKTGEATLAPYRRSDVCVVPAAGVVAEAMVCWTLACAVAEKFGGDSLEELAEFRNTRRSGGEEHPEEDR